MLLIKNLVLIHLWYETYKISLWNVIFTYPNDFCIKEKSLALYFTVLLFMYILCTYINYNN